MNGSSGTENDAFSSIARRSGDHANTLTRSFSSVSRGVLQPSNSTLRGAVVGEPFDFATSAATGIDALVRYVSAVTAFSRAIKNAVAGDEVEVAIRDRDAFEVVRNRRLAERKRFHDTTIVPVDLVDDGAFVVVREQAVVGAQGETGNLIEPLRQVPSHRVLSPASPRARAKRRRFSARRCAERQHDRDRRTAR